MHFTEMLKIYIRIGFSCVYHISRTTELTKSNLFIYLFTLSVGLKYDVVSRSAECCTQFSRERDQHTTYFPTDDIFLNFGDLLLTQNRNQCVFQQSNNTEKDPDLKTGPEIVAQL